MFNVKEQEVRLGDGCTVKLVGGVKTQRLVLTSRCDREIVLVFDSMGDLLTIERQDAIEVVLPS